MSAIDWDVIAPPRRAFEDLPVPVQEEIERQALETDADALRRLHREQN